MIVHFNIRNKLHDFRVCLRTGSNPANNNWFQGHTGIVIYVYEYCQTYFILACEQPLFSFERRNHNKRNHFKKCRIDFKCYF